MERVASSQVRPLSDVHLSSSDAFFTSKRLIMPGRANESQRRNELLQSQGFLGAAARFWQVRANVVCFYKPMLTAVLALLRIRLCRNCHSGCRIHSCKIYPSRKTWKKFVLIDIDPALRRPISPHVLAGQPSYPIPPCRSRASLRPYVFESRDSKWKR